MNTLGGLHSLDLCIGSDPDIAQATITVFEDRVVLLNETCMDDVIVWIASLFLHGNRHALKDPNPSWRPLAHYQIDTTEAMITPFVKLKPGAVVVGYQGQAKAEKRLILNGDSIELPCGNIVPLNRLLHPYLFDQQTRADLARSNFTDLQGPEPDKLLKRTVLRTLLPLAFADIDTGIEQARVIMSRASRIMETKYPTAKSGRHDAQIEMRDLIINALSTWHAYPDRINAPQSFSASPALASLLEEDACAATTAMIRRLFDEVRQHDVGDLLRASAWANGDPKDGSNHARITAIGAMQDIDEIITQMAPAEMLRPAWAKKRARKKAA